MDKVRTSSKNGPFSGKQREWAGCEQPFPGPTVADVSVPMFLKPGMFICTNTDKINIYDIHTLRNFTVSHMMMVVVIMMMMMMMMTTKISLFVPTSDCLASTNAVLFQYTVTYDD